LSLIFSAVISIVITYFGENLLDIILNSPALFFLFDVDNMLDNKHDYEHNHTLVQSQLDSATESPLYTTREGKVYLLGGNDAFLNNFLCL